MKEGRAKRPTIATRIVVIEVRVWSSAFRRLLFPPEGGTPKRESVSKKHLLGRISMAALTQKIIIGVVVVALLGLSVIGFLAGAAVYGWKAAQRAGNEAATLQNLKTIAAVEVQFYNTHDRTFGTFHQLVEEQMLTSKFAGDPPSPDSYTFRLNVKPKTSGQPSSFTLNADPKNDPTSGRHFYIDSTGATIHVNPDRPAGANDPPQ